MRRFVYVEQGDDGGADGLVHVIVSEEDIMRDYWPYWLRTLENSYRRTYGDNRAEWPEIEQEDCIDDFCIGHWAVPYEEPIPV